MSAVWKFKYCPALAGGQAAGGLTGADGFLLCSAELRGRNLSADSHVIDSQDMRNERRYISRLVDYKDYPDMSICRQIREHAVHCLSCGNIQPYIRVVYYENLGAGCKCCRKLQLPEFSAGQHYRLAVQHRPYLQQPEDMFRHVRLSRIPSREAAACPVKHFPDGGCGIRILRIPSLLMIESGTCQAESIPELDLPYVG